MLNLWAVIILFPFLAVAGPKDLREAERRAQAYETKLNDYNRLQEEKRRQKKDLGPVRELLKERREKAEKLESARRSYVVEKKRQRVISDRGFAKDLVEKENFRRARAVTEKDYLSGIQKIRRARKQFYEKVDAELEVGLEQGRPRAVRRK